jgi:hypothetical protein
MKRKAVKAISHEALTRAIESFKSRGGLIKTLPAEIEPTRNLVGARYAEFETITSTAVPESRGSSSGGEGAAA